MFDDRHLFLRKRFRSWVNIVLDIPAFFEKTEKRLIRIELTQVAWKATVLPLNYRRIKSSILVPQFPFFSKRFIPKLPEESIFGVVGFAPDFSSRARAVSISTAARAGRKIWGTSLPNSRFFRQFGYTKVEGV